MNHLLGLLTKFTDMGYGIVLGEWGVLDNVGEDRVEFFNNFLNNADLHGYATMLWDTGGLYCRTTHRIRARHDDDPAIEQMRQLWKSKCVDVRAEFSVDEIKMLAGDGIAWSLRKAANRPQFVFTAEEAFAWIMFASGDWAVQYSVGDQYRPESIAAGLIATDADVTAGAGTYTVALDFRRTAAGFADGFAFAAVGIVNGEILFPGYIMEIKELLINGVQATYDGRPYTTNDNPVTSRVNLYNEWVNAVPSEARATGGLAGASPTFLSNYRLTRIETLEITFEYIAR
jgi:endoglucanase